MKICAHDRGSLKHPLKSPSRTNDKKNGNLPMTGSRITISIVIQRRSVLTYWMAVVLAISIETSGTASTETPNITVTEVLKSA